MKKYNCSTIIFSSSATVYGNAQSPLSEKTSHAGKGISNPYGNTKYISETMLRDFAEANEEFNIICLRYFNPIGAHPSGLLGESPKGIPQNIMPFMLKVAKQLPEYKSLRVFGDDYETPDGSCIRDYIHVMDLAECHFKALEHASLSKSSFDIFNVGTGKGTSVFELIDTFKKVNNIDLPYTVVERRKGDQPSVYCDVSRAKSILNFEPKYSITDMCRDSWNYFHRSV